MLQQLARTGPRLMVQLKAPLQKRLRVRRDIARNGRRGIAHADLEYRLHLVELRPGVLAREHLDDEAADGPDVGFLGVGGLFDDFGRHPEDGTLEGGTVKAVAGHQVCEGRLVYVERE